MSPKRLDYAAQHVDQFVPGKECILEVLEMVLFPVVFNDSFTVACWHSGKAVYRKDASDVGTDRARGPARRR